MMGGSSVLAAQAIPSRGRAAMTLFFLAVGLFGMFTVEFSVVGVMPMIVERYGVSISQAGLLVSLFAAVMAVFGPIIVLWLSRYNSKAMLISALAVFSVCSVLSAWAPNFAVLLALRLPSALMLSVFFSVAFVTAVSLYPPDQAARAASMVIMGEGAGLVFGSPVITLIASSYSYEAAFYFCAMVCGVAAIWLSVVKLPDVRSKGQQLSGNLHILRSKAFWSALAFSILMFAAIYSVYSYTLEYLAFQGLHGAQASLVMFVFGLGGLIGTYLAGRAVVSSVRGVLVAGPILLVSCFALMMKVDHPPVVAMALICALWGAVQMGLVVSTQFLVTTSGKKAPQFATSLFVSAANVGITVGAAASGLWIAKAGIHGAIWTGWAFCAAAALALVIGLPVLKRAGLVK